MDNSVSLMRDVTVDSGPVFVTEVDEKHLCAHGEHLLRPPIKQSMCGHRFCSRCVQEMFLHADSVPCPGQEEDCVVLQQHEMTPDQAAAKELQRLDVYCTFKPNGCDQVVKWSKLADHEASCPYTTVKCTNEECQEYVLQSDLDKHLTECEFSSEHCSVCDKDILRRHMRNGHVQQCIVKPRKCLLEPLGCRFDAPSNDHKEHLLPCVVNHGKEISNAIEKHQSEQHVLQDNIQKMETAFGDLQKMVDSLSVHSHVDDTIRALQTSVAKVSDNLNAVKYKLDQSASTTQLQQCTDKLEQVQQAANAQESRISHLDHSSGSSGTNRDVLDKISRIETSIGMHDIRIAESDLRFRLLETAAFDGRLIWRIPQYSRRKQDAVESRTLSLYSQPVYSSYYGYKMCARVYLNGDGLGKGSHISMFFVVMKGEYDALLQWPFRQRVTLAVLDQSANRKHITDTFRPDPTSTSFRKPMGEMNIASGSPLFAPQSKVEAEPYLKDDTMFICVTIDMTDIPEPWV